MDDPTRDLYRVTRPDGTITHKSARDYGRPEHGASTGPTPTLGSAVITGTGLHGVIVHLYTDHPSGVRCAYVRLDSGRKGRFVLSDLRAAE